MIEKIVTHSGSFHADDVFATAILLKIFPRAQIVRTRDVNEITPGPDRIVYDVGSAYDPSRQIFDHHQPDPPLREDGSPYSSFGLIWEHYGKDWLDITFPNTENKDKLHGRIGRSFVKDVDGLDNGVDIEGGSSPLNITRIIMMMAPSFDDTKTHMNDAFMHSVHIASTVFENAVRNTDAKLRAERIMDRLLTTREPSPVLELPFGMPYEAAIRKAKADDILFVIIPRDGAWYLNGVRKEAGKFELRAKLPKEWGGLRDDDLAKVSGVEDAKFCHNGLFVASAESLSGVRSLARLALSRHLENEASVSGENPSHSPS